MVHCCRVEGVAGFVVGRGGVLQVFYRLYKSLSTRLLESMW